MNNPPASGGSSRLPRLIVTSVFALAIVLARYFSGHTAQAEPMLIIGKGSSYEKEWNRVDSLADKGLYRSALDLTNQIYDRAKKENNSGQVVKALIHRFKFSQQFQENSEDFAIYDLRNELKTAKFPLSPVLHSMLGDLYWQYYQRNSWKFSQRTQTSGFQNDSINTWDLNHLVSEAIKNYNASIVPVDSLFRTDEGIYADVLTKGNAEKDLRPTLYDFLAQRAVAFFTAASPA
ncbi:MAG TPA: hypothetical protein VFU15_15160, partial [Bacteroidia bacterium]|nr:hypothetical protein [Bacteroidia bacterium]